MTNTPTTVTRFDTFSRAYNEETGEGGDVIRLFHKRKLVTELSIDDVVREGWEDTLKEFIDRTQDGDARKTPVSAALVLDFLSDEVNEDDEEQQDGGSVVPEKYREIYGAVQHCGDDIALELSAFVTKPRPKKGNLDGGLDRAKLRGVAEANNIGDKFAKWEDRGLNGGLLRMDTANVLRGMNRRGEGVVIGSMVWAEDTSNPKHPNAKAAAKLARESAKAAAKKA